MHRFQRLSATAQTISAQLFEHERVIVDQTGVGLYDGKEKTVAFDNGRLYLTSHRLIYLDDAHPHRNSRYLDLHLVKQTEYWVGFFNSSPKITLSLAPEASSSSTYNNGDEARSERENGGLAQEALYDDESLHPSAQTWACHICGFRNLASSGSKCGLCGVTKAGGSTSSRSGTPSLVASSGLSSATSASSSPPRAATPTSDALIACPSCTFLNHPSMVRCEVCESPLGSLSTFSSHSRSASASSVPVSAPTSRPSTPSIPNGNGSGAAGAPFVRLSFRKGGVQAFYSALKKALQAKEWDIERKSAKRKAVSARNGTEIIGDSADGHRTTNIGIDGILKTIDLDARDREEDMQEALADLEALMARAKEMVSLAQTLNAKVAENPSSVDEGEQTVVKRSLASLGLATPAITSEMIADERQYHQELAKELATVLCGRGKGKEAVQLMEDGNSKRGLIGLDEIWCLWNRARGVALVSPKDLKQACQYLPTYTSPRVELRTFPSGLTVLHTPYFSESAFSSRIQDRLSPSSISSQASDDVIEEIPALTTLDVAQSESISVVLAQQMLEMLEGETPTVIVRDEGDPKHGTRWMLNLFEALEKQWDDVNNRS